MLNDDRVRERFRYGIRPGPAPRDAFRRAMAEVEEGGHRPRRFPLGIAAAVAVALAALLVAVLLFGVRMGPTSSTPAGNPSGLSTAGPSPAPSGPPAIAPPSPASTPTGTAGLPRCHASDLSGQGAGTGGAMGTLYSRFRLTNISQHACTMHGFPGLLLLDGQGRPLPTTTHWGDGSLARPGPALVRLEPGQQAHFHLAVSDVPDATRPACVTASELLVTPPDETTSLRIKWSIYACANGSLNASPIRPGPGTSDPFS